MARAVRSQRALHHHFLDVVDRFRRVQSLRAHLYAIHDGVAAEQLERAFKIGQSLVGFFNP